MWSGGGVGMSYESLLTQTGTIRHATGSTISPSGEVTRTYEPTGTAVRCDIQAARVGLMRRDVGEQVVGAYIGFFAIGTDVRETDKIVDDAGVEYLVLFVDAVRGHHLEAALQRGLW